MASKIEEKKMNRTTAIVFHGDACLGEVQVFPLSPTRSNNGGHSQSLFPNDEIRISHFSPSSERCPPLSILQTLSPASSVLRCKIFAPAAAEPSPNNPPEHSLIHRLYLACFVELKAAVVVVGNEQLHLVAMPTKIDRSSCFWCWSVPSLLYNSCLALLNMRCLSIVFDLDETLIVANSTRSFEDKIEALSQRIDAEDDPAKVSGMSAELKRYVEDRSLLKQYVENDSVWDSGRLFACQKEEVPPPSSSHAPIVRPVIRLLEKNIVLTRINPENRDTSVLVRLRPAWEELRSYLTAKGRKRFEVYVCTMAERDYALEIWRLLDPDAKLIGSKQLIDRIICVRPGSRKSLINVFHGSSSHPKLSMVVDDRINVWDDKDQSHVHAVPAFAPYYAPQAETANPVPVLCVARNVACSVRGAFFKEFDENFLRKISGVSYETDLSELPSPPDCGHYLLSEDITIPNGNRDMLSSENLNCAEGRKSFSSIVFSDTLCGQQPLQPVISTMQGIKEGSATLVPSLSMAVLLEIGRRCEARVEFKPVASSFKDLQFSVEALFNCEKIGLGWGRTRKEAQHQASDSGLRYLANHYIEFIGPERKEKDRTVEKLAMENENGFIDDVLSTSCLVFPKKESKSCFTVSDPVPATDDKRLDSVTSSIKDILSLDDNCNLCFHDCPPASTILNRGEYYFQVEVAGQVLGKAIALSKEAAKLQAAEDALRNLKLTSNFQTQKRSQLR